MSLYLRLMPSLEEFYQIADELRGVAALGLQFDANEYERERYVRVMKASARLIAAIENRVPDEIYAQFRDNLMHISPLAGVEAVVFRDGKILLIQRRDDGLWAMPGGLVEIGETLAQAVERELWEEANVRGRATQLFGIFDSRVWQTHTKVQLYCAIFRVESEDVPAPGSEALDARFFAENDLPELSQGHHLRVPFVFRLQRGEVATPYFDKCGLHSQIDPRVEVRSSPLHGKGIFASAPIRRGEVVIVWGGTIFSEQDIQAGKAAKHSCASIAEGLYLGGMPSAGNSPDDFMNHSCDPNVWMQDQVTLVARRNILVGEELTIDYAMFEGDESWMADWECQCGSKQCRKKITGKDWRIPEFQERYPSHFSPFINKRIEANKPNVP